MGLLDTFGNAMSDSENRAIWASGIRDMTAGFAGKQTNYVGRTVDRQRRQKREDSARKLQEMRMQNLIEDRALKEEQRKLQEQAMANMGQYLDPQQMAWMELGYGNQVADQQIKNLYGNKKKDTPFGKIDPSKYTPESLARFEQSGRYSDLKIPGVGVAPEVSDKDLFGRENTLRDDFRTDTRGFVTLQNQYSILKDSPKTGIGDVGRVFALMKMYDPGSTVREGEQATAQNAAGVPSWLRSQANHIFGGGTLDEQARTEMLEAGSGLYQKAYGGYQGNVKRYTASSERYGLNPEFIGTMDYPNLYTPPQAPQKAAPTPGSVVDPDVNAGFQAYYDTLPSGATYSAPDGTVRIKP